MYCFCCSESVVARLACFWTFRFNVVKLRLIVVELFSDICIVELVNLDWSGFVLVIEFASLCV